MSISVNGQPVVPPGFRFHPTEEELLTYYLKKKVASERIDLDVIRDVDLNKLEPWDIQEKCRVGSGPQNEWYLFSHKDKKYPTGTRTNRATAAGFWKATGRDKAIYSCARRVGMRKTLVFYKGRAPHGQKSDWIMHEYRLDDDDHAAAAGDHPYYYYPSPPTTHPPAVRGGAAGDQAAQEDGWVICRVFKKKNLVVHHHGQLSSGGGGPTAAHTAAAAAPPAMMMESSPTSNCSSVTVSGHVKKAQMLHSAASDDDALDHILHQYMGSRPPSSHDNNNDNKQDTKPPAALTTADHHHLAAAAAATTACPSSSFYYGKLFMKLPPLEHVVVGPLAPSPAAAAEYAPPGGIADWDSPIAAYYELNNGLSADASKNMAAAFFDDDEPGSGDGDLWSLARSVSSLHADQLTMNNA